MKRSEFLKRGGAVAVLAVVAPKVLVRAATDAPVVAAADTATTLTVSDGGVFRVGDVIRNVMSNEAMVVTTIDTDTLTVVRGIGSLAPTPIHRGDEITMVAAAVEQGAWLDDRMLPRMAAAGTRVV